MDLAEIRKKAQQQAATSDEQALLEPAIAAELLADEETDLEFSLAAAEEQTATGLQQFFPELNFASEEDYIQGLSGNEKNLEVETVQWLTFLLGEEEYALSLDVVMELLKPRAYTDLPDVPEYIRGILSLRGVVVPVIDLRVRLQLSYEKELTSQRIIICEGEEQPIGLLVDRITQVVRLPKESIEQAPLLLKDVENNFVSGIGRYQGRMLILLNPDEVLNL